MSVRELEAKNRLRQLGRQDVVHVCDPVALDEGTVQRNEPNSCKGPYILVYAINRSVLAQVVNIVHSHQLQVVAIGVLQVS